MSNFELIDDYLTNRLGEQEKLEFERQLGADPSLKADVELQQNIIEGVKRARIADLKAMLNNVPVGSGLSSGAAAGKIAAAIVTAGIIGTSLYFYFQKTETATTVPNEIKAKSGTKESHAPKAADSLIASTPLVVAKPITSTDKGTTRKSVVKRDEKKPVPTVQPRIEATDPSEELVDNSATHATKAESKQSVTLSRIAVDTDSNNKKYTFHYQFRDGKLTLFGSFDKSLYEILEIHGDRHAVFLFYKDVYYLLNEKQIEITPLEPIKDATLVRKLREYRAGK